MAENDEEARPSIRDPNINTISELPGRPFRLSTEVPLFLTLLALTLSGPVVNNIVLYRTCVHALHHSTDECKAFLEPVKSNTSKQLEEEVQKYSTYISVTKTLIEAIGPAILSLFVGVWSDTYGRRPLIIWPLFGMSLSAIMTGVYGLLGDFGPWWIVLTAVPITLTGGYTVLFTGAFTYISDVTTTENRSMRMTVLEMTFSAGNFIGSIISSYLIRLVGNLYVLLINALLYVLAYAFTMLYLTESLNGAQQGSLRTLMDFSLVKEMVRACTKKRPKRGRLQMLLLVLSSTLSIFIMYGLLSLTYLYAREKLHWAVKEYSIYTSANTLIHVCGALLGLKLGKKLFGLGDLSLILLGYISLISEFTIVALASTTLWMYIASSTGVFKGLSSPLIRSYLSKMLPVQDIAKVFALLSAFEAICPLLSPLMYNSLYYFTISTFPGSIYMLSAAITCVCVAMISVVKYLSVKEVPYQPMEVDRRDSTGAL